MVLLQGEGGVRGPTLTPEGSAQMPKFILAAVAPLVDRPPSARDEAARSAMHARTRSREAVRRLRASNAHEARPDLRALELTMRH
jgi:hypothetical protein